MLTHDKADKLLQSDPRNKEVVFRAINGDEINNEPLQEPQRSIISFQNWPEEKARQYSAPFEIVEERVKPARMSQKDKTAKQYWWRHTRTRNELYLALKSLPFCFVVTRVTKHLSFSIAPTSHIFLNTIYVFVLARWDLFSILQSSLHEVWARKYSMSLGQTMQYSPSDCFENFPFPDGILRTKNSALASMGEQYHEYRRALMRQLWLGLTDIYNLFHTRDLTPERVAKVSKKSLEEAEAGYAGIIELRRLHVELDTAIRDVYDWHDLKLGHDFIEVETLPENDRVRYTISPEARKEILKRLLALNHQRAAEQDTLISAKTKSKRAKKTQGAENQADLFT